MQIPVKRVPGAPPGGALTIVAAANPAYAPAAAPATILVAACVVVTSMLPPLITAGTAQMVGARPGAGPDPATRPLFGEARVSAPRGIRRA